MPSMIFVFIKLFQRRMFRKQRACRIRLEIQLVDLAECLVVADVSETEILVKSLLVAAEHVYAEPLEEDPVLGVFIQPREKAVHEFQVVVERLVFHIQRHVEKVSVVFSRETDVFGRVHREFALGRVSLDRAFVGFVIECEHGPVSHDLVLVVDEVAEIIGAVLDKLRPLLGRAFVQLGDPRVQIEIVFDESLRYRQRSIALGIQIFSLDDAQLALFRRVRCVGHGRDLLVVVSECGFYRILESQDMRMQRLCQSFEPVRRAEIVFERIVGGDVFDAERDHYRSHFGREVYLVLDVDGFFGIFREYQQKNFCLAYRRDYRFRILHAGNRIAVRDPALDAVFFKRMHDRVGIRLVFARIRNENFVHDLSPW